MLKRLKDRHPEAYYEVGDKVFHPQRGNGIVVETIPCNYWTQKIFIRFEDNSDGVFTAKAICKIVNGVVIPYSKNTTDYSNSNPIKPVQLSIEDLFPLIFSEQE